MRAGGWVGGWVCGFQHENLVAPRIISYPPPKKNRLIVLYPFVPGTFFVFLLAVVFVIFFLP